MIKTSIKLQELRRKVYVKAKAETDWRFWGLYVHVCKTETLMEAYKQAKSNKGAPGIDGLTFEAIEAAGLDQFLQAIQTELREGTYQPVKRRKVAIPKPNGKMRELSIPTIKDRVVEGALKLILESIFEADFQPGSFGYRPKKTAAEAVNHIKTAVIRGKTRVIEVDLSAYFDTIAHAELFTKVARRVNDKQIMRLLKLIVKAGGQKGVAQGGPLSPLLSNIYLNEVDKMLEKAKQVTQRGAYTCVDYARWADDVVIAISGHSQWKWLEQGIQKRLREELSKLKLTLNEEKSKIVDVNKGETFSFLGFDIIKRKSRKGQIILVHTPRMKARTNLIAKLKEVFKRSISQPINKVIDQVNPILRGWVNYFRTGNSRECFSYVKDWVEKKVRNQLNRSRQRTGFGWKRWSKSLLYDSLGLYKDYAIRYYKA